jgi:hypothetical protein
MASLPNDKECLVRANGFTEELNLALDAGDNPIQKLGNNTVQGFWQGIVDTSVDINVDTKLYQPLDLFQIAMDCFKSVKRSPSDKQVES